MAISKRAYRWSPLTLTLAFSLLAGTVCAQSDPTFRSWNQPVEPFRIIGNVYYVGASDITSFLITTPAGHILIEGGFAETAPLIEESVRRLGFRLTDIKILLSSHAHADHAGGLAELKRVTGARLIASTADAPLLASGGHGDFHWGDRLPFPPVTADETIADGGKIELGGVVLTARPTPGHTRGNLTWTLRTEEGGRSYDVVFVGSVTAPGYQLVGNKAYPQIATDFARSVAMLRALPCDVFLAPHGMFFGLTEKRRRQAAGATPNPFIDPAGYRDALARAEAALAAQLEKEQSAASGTTAPKSAETGD